MRYDITEVVTYRLEIDGSVDDALAYWLDSREPDYDPRIQFLGVDERIIEEVA